MIIYNPEKISRRRAIEIETAMGTSKPGGIIFMTAQEQKAISILEPDPMLSAAYYAGYFPVIMGGE